MSQTLWGILCDGPSFCEHKVVAIKESTRAIIVKVGKEKLMYRQADKRFHQGANAYEFWLNSDDNRNRMHFRLRTGDDVPNDLELEEHDLSRCDYWNPTMQVVVRSKRRLAKTPMFTRKSHMPTMEDVGGSGALHRDNFRM